MHKSGTISLFDFNEQGEVVNVMPIVAKTEHVYKILNLDKSIKLIDANRLYQEEITNILKIYADYLNRTPDELALEITEKRNNSVMENDYYHNHIRVWHSDVITKIKNMEIKFVLDFIDDDN